MKREPIIWSMVAGVLVASWLAIPFALKLFDPLPPDTPPNAFLGLGPVWLWVWLSINALATLCFLALLMGRLFVAAADYVLDRFRKKSN